LSSATFSVTGWHVVLRSVRAWISPRSLAIAFFDGRIATYERPVFGDQHRPKVYPRKSNVSSGTRHTRVLASFTVNFSVAIILRIAASAFAPVPRQQMTKSSA
jgi:hypothetical protein